MKLYTRIRRVATFTFRLSLQHFDLKDRMKRAQALMFAAALLAGVCGNLVCTTQALAIAVATDGAALAAPRGATALSGQVLQLNGKPLAGVTLRIRDAVAVSDRSGRFVLDHDVPAGTQVLRIEGSSADRRGRTYGDFEASVEVAVGRATMLPYKIWMPELDTAHAISIPSPTTKETVVRSPLAPGLEVRIPAGMVITDWSGHAVHRLTITRIPVDRPPFPLPATARGIPMYFTIQPGGAYLVSTDGNYKGARVYIPTPGICRRARATLSGTIASTARDLAGRSMAMGASITGAPKLSRIAASRSTRSRARWLHLPISDRCLRRHPTAEHAH